MQSVFVNIEQILRAANGQIITKVPEGHNIHTDIYILFFW